MDFNRVKELFGERFNRERKTRGYSADALAEVLGVDRKSVLSWDKGCVPKVEHLIKISELFECDIDYLIGKQEHKTKAKTDIAQVTGLSSEAIELLIKAWNKQRAM